MSQPFQTAVWLYLLWSKLVTLFILWGDPNSTLHTGSTDSHGRRDIFIPSRAVILLCGWKAVISPVYMWMSDRRSLGRWSENWGEIAGQSSPGGALGLVLLCVPGQWRHTQWGRWSANADWLRVVEYSRALKASFCDWCMPACPYAFVFVMAHVCISLWPTFFVLTLHSSAL